MTSQQNNNIDILSVLNNFVEDFSYLDEWEDKYTYIIDLGKKLPLLDESLKTDATKVEGCISQVWLYCETYHDAESPDIIRLRFFADSDALIVKGLIAILLAIYNNQPVHEILSMEPEKILKAIDIENYISPNRRNGFRSVLNYIKSYAEKNR